MQQSSWNFPDNIQSIHSETEEFSYECLWLILHNYFLSFEQSLLAYVEDHWKLSWNITEKVNGDVFGINAKHHIDPLNAALVTKCCVDCSEHLSGPLHKYLLVTQLAFRWMYQSDCRLREFELWRPFVLFKPITA